MWLQSFIQFVESAIKSWLLGRYEGGQNNWDCRSPHDRYQLRTKKSSRWPNSVSKSCRNGRRFLLHETTVIVATCPHYVDILTVKYQSERRHLRRRLPRPSLGDAIHLLCHALKSLIDLRGNLSFCMCFFFFFYFSQFFAAIVNSVACIQRNWLCVTFYVYWTLKYSCRDMQHRNADDWQVRWVRRDMLHSILPEAIHLAHCGHI